MMSGTDTSHGNSRSDQRIADHGTLVIQERVSALYETHREAIYYFLLKRRLEPSAAQDLAQDVFVQLFIALSHGTKIESERAWLYGVAAKSAVNHWRRKVRERSIALDTVPEIAWNLKSSEPTPEAAVMEQQRARRVTTTLARLPELQRAAIRLRMQGLRYRAIASALDVSLSTVSELLAGAVERLRSAANG